MLPESVLWCTGPVGCVGAVSDQCAKFDATLGWESVAMPPSVICPDTWLVLWMVTLLSPADWSIVVLMFSVGILVLCSAFSWGRSFVDAAMRVPRFQLLLVAALLVASLVSFGLLVQWPVTYANNVGFFNFFGVAAAAAFPLCVFTTAATDALWRSYTHW